MVLQLQKRIKQEHNRTDDPDKQIVIYGKSGHAEVLGLVGQTAGRAIVIENLEEAKQLDFHRSIRLYSQTTKSLSGFREVVDYIQAHIEPGVSFQYYDTICRQVANRIPNMIDSAAEIDGSLLAQARSIGVCGATSTPKWLMEEIEQALREKM